MAKLIALDAGHGYNTKGKRCMKRIDANETREWWLNNRIMDRVEELLAKYSCKILRVDDTTGAKNVSLSNRVKAANKAEADIYISMHHNAGINGGIGGGTVVFYYSGKAERKEQAQRLYDAIVSRTGLVGNRASKVVKKGLYVVAKTSMPAFLVENGFMDSKTDVPIILTEEHAEKTAQGVVAFLIEALRLDEGVKLTEHIVKKGDTLTRIADVYGVTVSAIANCNSIANPNQIYVGQVIKIPR